MTNVRLALIKNGIVHHVISVDAEYAVFTEEANAGWIYDPATGSLTRPPQPPEDGVDEPPSP